MFRRWNKGRHQESYGDEHTDSEYSFHRRTVPPIAGLTNGMSPATDRNNNYVELNNRLSAEKELDEEKIYDNEEKINDAEVKKDLEVMFTGKVSTECIMLVLY